MYSTVREQSTAQPEREKKAGVPSARCHGATPSQSISAQELKCIVRYGRRVQHNLSAKRKQAYPVRGAVEPRLLNQSDQREDGTGSHDFLRPLEKI